MTPVVPAAGAALMVAGCIGVVVGLRPAPARPAGPTIGWLTRTSTSLSRVSKRTRLLALTGLTVGLIVAVVTGWVIAIVLAPAAAVGLPILLSAPPVGTHIARLEAMEEWIRSLSGVLTVGVGLEQALTATLRSTPEPIRGEVAALTARLRARWSTEAALRAFADDLDDATGDLIAANLILGARRRGAGLANVLEALAESVAADVRARRAIEADRAKPRATARWVSIITVSVLAVLALTGDYITPYGSPAGQLLLGVLLAAYVATLIWMKSMTAGTRLPRFVNAAKAGTR